MSGREAAPVVDGVHLFVGGFTKEFPGIFHELRTNGNSWERGWMGGGTASSGWKADQIAYRDVQYSAGIERYEFTASEGRLRHVATISDGLVNPQNLALHPRLPVLYAAEYSLVGGLRSFALTAAGADPLSAVPSLGRLAIATTVHPSATYAYIAHWGDGTLSAVPLDDDGRPGEATLIARGDSEPESPRFSRHHQVRVSPAGNAVLVSDVARDEVTVYRCSDGTLDPEPIVRIPFPERSAPRHLEFDPSGRWVYVVTERLSSLFVLAADEGIPCRILASYPTCPADFGGNNRPSELCLHPNGRSLYVGNRGLDAVTTYRREDDGTLVVIDHQPTLGKNLSCLQLDPTGQYLIAGNVDPGNLVVFRVGADGQLERVGDPVDALAPRSLVFCSFTSAGGRVGGA